MQLRSGRITEKHLQRITTIVFENSVEEEVEAHELQKILDQEIAALPEKCREVFYLSRVELLPNKKIAEKLQISPKTVENQITKALRSLRMSVDKLTILAAILLS
jgi:RNA polymerase sigma factor (sigma-70 family)